MPKHKIKIGIICGGQSAEHEVSLQSAKNIIEAIDRNKYDIVLLGITKKGKWILQDVRQFLKSYNKHKLAKLDESGKNVMLLAGGRGRLIDISGKKLNLSIDVAFPVLHGPFGEDGTVQGLLELADIPFVGSAVLGSAIGIDKDIQKRLAREAGIPVAKFLVFNTKDQAKIKFKSIARQLRLPLFVKPARLGSSIGINKVTDENELKKAVREAFQYDNKILIEEFVDGREIECSVLGNDEPVASLPGEVVPRHDFYSYEAKYSEENGAILQIPAKISKKNIQKIRKVAVDIFKTLSCEGMGRVDFFLKADECLIFNEINTIPGFTSRSMYPLLWEANGISYDKLLDKLIDLAIERFKKTKLYRE